VEENLANDMYKKARLLVDAISEQDNPDQERIKLPLELLTKCLQQRKRILYKFNPKIAQAHDTIAQLHAIYGDYKKAAVHCQQAIKVQQNVFGEDSVEIGHEVILLYAFINPSSMLNWHNYCSTHRNHWKQ
jgi:hypothetical protein